LRTSTRTSSSRAERGDEQRRLAPLARDRIEPRNAVAGVVDEELLAAVVRLAHRQIELRGEAMVVLAELGVLVAVGVLLLVLLPQERERDVLASQLRGDVAVVR